MSMTEYVLARLTTGAWCGDQGSDLAPLTDDEVALVLDICGRKIGSGQEWYVVAEGRRGWAIDQIIAGRKEAGVPVYPHGMTVQSTIRNVRGMYPENRPYNHTIPDRVSVESARDDDVRQRLHRLAEVYLVSGTASDAEAYAAALEQHGRVNAATELRALRSAWGPEVVGT